MRIEDTGQSEDNLQGFSRPGGNQFTPFGEEQFSIDQWVNERMGGIQAFGPGARFVENPNGPFGKSERVLQFEQSGSHGTSKVHIGMDPTYGTIYARNAEGNQNRAYVISEQYGAGELRTREEVVQNVLSSGKSFLGELAKGWKDQNVYLPGLQPAKRAALASNIQMQGQYGSERDKNLTALKSDAGAWEKYFNSRPDRIGAAPENYVLAGLQAGAVDFSDYTKQGVGSWGGEVSTVKNWYKRFNIQGGEETAGIAFKVGKNEPFYQPAFMMPGQKAQQFGNVENERWYLMGGDMPEGQAAVRKRYGTQSFEYEIPEGVDLQPKTAFGGGTLARGYSKAGTVGELGDMFGRSFGNKFAMTIDEVTERDGKRYARGTSYSEMTNSKGAGIKPFNVPTDASQLPEFGDTGRRVTRVGTMPDVKDMNSFAMSVYEGEFMGRGAFARDVASYAKQQGQWTGKLSDLMTWNKDAKSWSLTEKGAPLVYGRARENLVQGMKFEQKERTVNPDVYSLYEGINVYNPQGEAVPYMEKLGVTESGSIRVKRSDWYRDVTRFGRSRTVGNGRNMSFSLESLATMAEGSPEAADLISLYMKEGVGDVSARQMVMASLANRQGDRGEEIIKNAGYGVTNAADLAGPINDILTNLGPNVQGEELYSGLLGGLQNQIGNNQFIKVQAGDKSYYLPPMEAIQSAVTINPDTGRPYGGLASRTGSLLSSISSNQGMSGPEVDAEMTQRSAEAVGELERYIYGEGQESVQKASMGLNFPKLGGPISAHEGPSDTVLVSRNYLRRKYKFSDDELTALASDEGLNGVSLGGLYTRDPQANPAEYGIRAKVRYFEDVKKEGADWAQGLSNPGSSLIVPRVMQMRAGGDQDQDLGKLLLNAMKTKDGRIVSSKITPAQDNLERAKALIKSETTATTEKAEERSNFFAWRDQVLSGAVSTPIGSALEQIEAGRQSRAQVGSVYNTFNRKLGSVISNVAAQSGATPEVAENIRRNAGTFTQYATQVAVDLGAEGGMFDKMSSISRYFDPSTGVKNQPFLYTGKPGEVTEGDQLAGTSYFSLHAGLEDVTQTLMGYGSIGGDLKDPSKMRSAIAGLMMSPKLQEQLGPEESARRQENIASLIAQYNGPEAGTEGPSARPYTTELRNELFSNLGVGSYAEMYFGTDYGSTASSLNAMSPIAAALGGMFGVRHTRERIGEPTRGDLNYPLAPTLRGIAQSALSYSNAAQNNSVNKLLEQQFGPGGYQGRGAGLGSILSNLYGGSGAKTSQQLMSELAGITGDVQFTSGSLGAAPTAQTSYGRISVNPNLPLADLESGIGGYTHLSASDLNPQPGESSEEMRKRLIAKANIPSSMYNQVAPLAGYKGYSGPSGSTDTGDAMHPAMVSRLGLKPYEKGGAPSDYQAEVPLNNPNLQVSGRMDLAFGGSLLDIKTMGEGSWKNLTNSWSMEKYGPQLAAYNQVASGKTFGKSGVIQEAGIIPLPQTPEIQEFNKQNPKAPIPDNLMQAAYEQSYQATSALYSRSSAPSNFLGRDESFWSGEYDPGFFSGQSLPQGTSNWQAYQKYGSEFQANLNQQAGFQFGAVYQPQGYLAEQFEQSRQMLENIPRYGVNTTLAPETLSQLGTKEDWSRWVQGAANTGAATLPFGTPVQNSPAASAAPSGSANNPSQPPRRFYNKRGGSSRSSGPAPSGGDASGGGGASYGGGGSSGGGGGSSAAGDAGGFDWDRFEGAVGGLMAAAGKRNYLPPTFSQDEAAAVIGARQTFLSPISNEMQSALGISDSAAMGVSGDYLPQILANWGNMTPQLKQEALRISKAYGRLERSTQGLARSQSYRDTTGARMNPNGAEAQISAQIMGASAETAVGFGWANAPITPIGLGGSESSGAATAIMGLAKEEGISARSTGMPKLKPLSDTQVDSALDAKRGLDDFNSQIEKMAQTLPGLNKLYSEHLTTINQLEKDWKPFSSAVEKLGANVRAAAAAGGEYAMSAGEQALSPYLEGGSRRGEYESLRSSVGSIFDRRDKQLRETGYAGGVDFSEISTAELLSVGGDRGKRLRRQAYEAGAFEGTALEGFSEQNINRIATGMRGIQQVMSPWSMAAINMASNMLIQPGLKAAQGYQNYMTQQGQMLMQSGAMSYSEMMNDPYGSIVRREAAVSNNYLNFGKEAYNVWSPLLNTAMGVGGGAGGALSAIAGPALGAGVIANRVLTPFLGAAALPAGLAVAGATALLGGASYAIGNRENYGSMGNVVGSGNILSALSNPGGAAGAIANLVGVAFNPNDPGNQQRWVNTRNSDVITGNADLFARGAITIQQLQGNLNSANQQLGTDFSRSQAIGTGLDQFRNTLANQYGFDVDKQGAQINDLSSTFLTYANRLPNEQELAKYAPLAFMGIMPSQMMDVSNQANNLAPGSARSFSSMNSLANYISQSSNPNLALTQSRWAAPQVGQINQYRQLMGQSQMSIEQGVGYINNPLALRGYEQAQQYNYSQMVSSAWYDQNSNLGSLLSDLNSPTAPVENQNRATRIEQAPGFAGDLSRLAYRYAGPSNYAIGSSGWSDLNNKMGDLQTWAADTGNIAAASNINNLFQMTSGRFNPVDAGNLGQTLTARGVDLGAYASNQAAAMGLTPTSRNNEQVAEQIFQKLVDAGSKSPSVQERTANEIELSNLAAPQRAQINAGRYAVGMSAMADDNYHNDLLANPFTGGITMQLESLRQRRALYGSTGASLDDIESQIKTDPRGASRAMAAMNGDQIINTQMARAGQKSMMFNTVDLATGGNAYQYGIDSQEYGYIQNWAKQNGLSGMMGTAAQMAGGTVQLQEGIRQIGVAQNLFSYQNQITQAQLGFTLETGGASVGAQGFAQGGSLAGYQQQLNRWAANTNAFNQKVAQASGTAAPPPVTAPTFNAGNGMTLWQVQDAQTQLSRQQQTWNLQQSQQSFGIQQQQFALAGQQFYERWNFDVGKFNYETQYQRGMMQFQRQQQKTQFGWQQEDLNYQQNVADVNFGWQMQDFDRNIRYARGREKLDLMREQQRAVVTFSMQQGQRDKEQDRFQQQEKWAEQLYNKQKDYFEKETQFQRESLDMQKRFFEQNRALEQQKMQMTQQNLQKEMSWMQQEWALEDQQRTITRSAQIVEFQMQQSIATATYNAQVQTLNLSNAITITNAALQAQIDKENALAAAAGSATSNIGSGGNPSVPNAGGAWGGMMGNYWGQSSAYAFGGMTGFNPTQATEYMRSMVTSWANRGDTGGGFKYEPTMRVHGGEYVVPQGGSLVVHSDSQANLLKEVVMWLRKIHELGPGRMENHITVPGGTTFSSKVLTGNDRSYARP